MRTNNPKNIPTIVNRRFCGISSHLLLRTFLNFPLGVCHTLLYMVSRTFDKTLTYRLIVEMSLFSRMLKPSIIKPLGLSSDLDELVSLQVVIRLRSVTLL